MARKTVRQIADLLEKIDTAMLTTVGPDGFLVSRPLSTRASSFDGKRVWSSDQAVFPKELPASIGIIGAGAIGMEFADVYNAFGSKVTVIEALEQVLPLEDADCASVVEKSYRKRKIDIMTGARLEKADVGKTNVKLHV